MKLFYLRRETTVGEESNVKLGKIQTKTTNIKKIFIRAANTNVTYV